jgi:riboflavin kinase/FMN adenylyltransferase
LTVLRPELAPPRLTPIEFKNRLLAEVGVEHLVVLPPSPDVLNLSAEAFWAILRDEVRPAHLVEGETFTFGKGRGGTIAKLREWSQGTSIQVTIIDPVEVPLLDLNVVPVSSSLVRWLIANGRVRDASICLNRPYALFGPVVKGFQRGRQLGFPTANLQVESQLLPADGVYAARCTVAGKTYPTAVSIGTLPTFNETTRQVEAHLIGFDGDLYGQTLQVEMIDWLRDQRKFPSLDALKHQLAKDLQETVQRCRAPSCIPIAAA